MSSSIGLRLSRIRTIACSTSIVRNVAFGSLASQSPQQQQQQQQQQRLLRRSNCHTTTLLYGNNDDDNESGNNTGNSIIGANNCLGNSSLFNISNNYNISTDYCIVQKQQQQKQRSNYISGSAATTITSIRHFSSGPSEPKPATTPPPTNTSTTTTAATTTEKKRSPKSRINNVRVQIQAANAKYKKPTLEIADKMPLSIQEVDNISLVTMAAMNSSQAHVEMLKRHIMSIDRIKYDDACIKFKEIQLANNQYLWLIALPYRVGIVAGVTAAAASIPMVFYFPLADWFNKGYVTTSLPPPEDIETMLEVGS
jgi:hypothetical protein